MKQSCHLPPTFLHYTCYYVSRVLFFKNMMLKYTGWATKNLPAFSLHLHLATVSASVFILCYGPGLLCRGPLRI
jgi:hypothetical protein